MTTDALQAAVQAMRDHDPERMECADHDGRCCPCGMRHAMSLREADLHRATEITTAYQKGQES